jgi:hypothetical protein
VGKRNPATGPELRHQPVPGRVEIDAVDAATTAIEGVQFGRVLVGLFRLPKTLDRPDHGAV